MVRLEREQREPRLDGRRRRPLAARTGGARRNAEGRDAPQLDATLLETGGDEALGDPRGLELGILRRTERLGGRTHAEPDLHLANPRPLGALDRDADGCVLECERQPRELDLRGESARARASRTAVRVTSAPLRYTVTARTRLGSETAIIRVPCARAAPDRATCARSRPRAPPRRGGRRSGTRARVRSPGSWSRGARAPRSSA